MYDSRLSLHIFCSNSRREGRGFYKDSDDEMVRSKTLSSGEEEERKRQRRDGKLLYDSPVVDKAKLIFRDGPHSSPSTTSAVNVDDACVVQAEFVTPPGKVEQPSATTAPAALNLSSMFDQPASTYLMLKQAKVQKDLLQAGASRFNKKFGRDPTEAEYKLRVSPVNVYKVEGQLEMHCNVMRTYILRNNLSVGDDVSIDL